MRALDQAGLTWHKASKSHGVGACVELAVSGERILLRDSKNPGVHLSYTPAEIDAFIDGAKRGEFDHLLGRA
ncbi:hypothetical protein BJF78_19730 [Pseudonocardia sp. CNS-139]|nr:hypothetical protein BJF78_19730 [Pseudonocardia sp. CNS-139]